MTPPKAMRRNALIRFAEEVYEARYEKDALYVKGLNDGSGEGRSLQSFSAFVYDYCCKRYGLKALVRDNCWGMVSSVELQRAQSVAIDTFGKFLEGCYDSTDLLFFLYLRGVMDKVLGNSHKSGEELVIEADFDDENNENSDRHVKPKGKAS